MRTKTLLLTAAVIAVSAIASQAQVYSVNAVGYVNVTLAARYNLLSNPLNGTNNNINTIIPVALQDSTVLKFNTTSQNFSSIDTYFDVGDPAVNGWYVGDNRSTTTLNPGEAFFFFNPGAAGTTLTFVGEVPQGTLTNPITPLYGFYASVVPQAATLSSMGFAPVQDMTIQTWDTVNQRYTGLITYFDVGDPLVNGWYDGADNKYDPASVVGGGFLLFNPGAARNWVRTFSVNNN